MAKKAKPAEVNKSAAIRDLIAKNPDMKVKEIMAKLEESGISVQSSMVYTIKGKISGTKTRRRKRTRKMVEKVAASPTGAGVSKGDILATILKIQSVASEVGGLKKLKELAIALEG